jgi:hypothetical protein
MPTGTAARPPSSTMKGVASVQPCRLRYATAQAPIAPKLSWQSDIIPARPVTTPMLIATKVPIAALVTRNSA